MTSPTHPASASEEFERLADVILLIGVASAAAVFSWHNVLHLAEDHGQKDWLAWVIAGCIETTAVKGGLEYRRRHRLGQPVSFAVALVAAAAGLQLAAQVAEVDPKFGPWGYILAAVPAATFLTLVKVAVSRSGAPAGLLAAAQASLERAEALVLALQGDLEQARADLAAKAAPTVAPVAPPPPAPPAETRESVVGAADKPAPSREEARAILMGLEDFEAVSNGQLSREHGCSDVWWGRQKKALRTELAELTTEANAL